MSECTSGKEGPTLCTDVAVCDMCGSGLSPDERMSFKGQTKESIQAAGYEMLTQAQLMLSSAECCFAKVREMESFERSLALGG